jgi:putative phosphoribosyl transferase
MKDTTTKLVNIKTDSVTLTGELNLPMNARGVVLFAHGSGSSRHSPRNKFVAQVLQKDGFATLLIDLLTEEEDIVYQTRFDIDLLAGRLLKITEWLSEENQTKDLSIGYFGASTGAAAALKAAAISRNPIAAVVSRGGRPDLAEPLLEEVKAPTLLIVGGYDDIVIGLNKLAYSKLRSTKELEIVPGATHLFEEPGTLNEAARLADEWFQKYMPALK